VRRTGTLLFGALILSAAAPAQQAPAQAPAPTPKPSVARQLFEIYQVDLVPTGTGFAVTKPVLEGDVWVFKVWPDRSTVRLAQSKVKKITHRTKQLESDTAYRIDLEPSGQIFSRDNPVLKGTTYTFHRWRGGALMSLRQADVKKITRLTPIEIFQTHLQYFGPRPIGDLPMEGGTVVMPAEPAAPAQEATATGGAENWIYYGTPGVDEAWSPGNAVIASPGDVPKAPEPR
jgi:hypothetical protein